jgi:tRNA threonylcarbamoyladenosine biosynthesis protein TsaB
MPYYARNEASPDRPTPVMPVLTVCTGHLETVCALRMLSLRALLVAHKTLLVIDSSSATVQLGLFRTDAAPGGEWEKSVGEAGTMLFQNVEKLLRRTDFTLMDIGAIAFCEGPGSVLGIRTTAVAIRTWGALRPLPTFAFGSLTVVAHGVVAKDKATNFSVIADARRDNWHRVRADDAGNISLLQRVPVEELRGPLMMPDGFRHWALPPPNIAPIHYDLAQWLPIVNDVELFRLTAEPDAFLHEEPTYQTWTPRVHRAPS